MEDKILEIQFKSNKLERQCLNYQITVRDYGTLMASKIRQRINEIASACSIDELVINSIGRCHPLHGNRKSEYAMDLVHPFRLVFEKSYEQVVTVKILDIEDYH